MRRPAFCSSVLTTEEDCYCSGPLVPRDNGDKEEGRLARVKRMLAGTLSIGRGRGRVFGARFDELPVGKEGVPKIAVRLCGYIENYGLRCAGLFRLSAGNPKLVERLRISFDRTGEADLEAAGDPQSVASLFKLWLRELPEPIILGHVAEELLDIQEKFHDDLPEWRSSVSRTLLTLPESNLRLLHYVLRFLHRCATQSGHPPNCIHAAPGGVSVGGAGGIEGVFSPLLIRGSLVARNETAAQLTGKMIREMKHIFTERFVEHAYQSALGGWSGGAPEKDGANKDAAAPAKHQRKRKERHESFNSQTQERKVIRSNSEERPLETSEKDNMRRVSSHEDFSKGNNKVLGGNKIGGGFLQELIDPGVGLEVHVSRPLHEHNSPAVSRHPSRRHPPQGGGEDDAAALLEEENERRRSTERWARSGGRRNVNRRKKAVGYSRQQQRGNHREGERGSGSSKENEEEGDVTRAQNQQLTPVSSSTSDEDTCRGEHKPHAFLQLHPQEKDRSPSPSSSPPTPHLDLTSLHELVDCNEPLKSRNRWSFSHRQHEDERLPSSQVMLSPRTSLVFPQRGGVDSAMPPSPSQEHGGLRGPPVQDLKMKQLNKQISSVKRKLKRFEEDFELEFGYRPSHTDKMGNRDVKNLGADLSKLRKEMKLLKEDNMMFRMAKPTGLVLANDESLQSKAVGSNTKMEDILQEVEQVRRRERLTAKRQAAGRPADVDSLTRDQLLDEKVALQKGLLYLESVFGRPVTRAERDVVRPLYDRYRTLKRMVVRTCSSKLKDSISELATILEHETMDFTSLPAQQPPAAGCDAADGDSGLGAMVPLILPLTAIAAADTISEGITPQLENLHSLPLSKLLDQQRTVREEKKQLRRSLREFEDQFQRRTGRKLQREDRLPMEQVYVAYKQSKAKLRLLEALVSKHSTSTLP